MNQRIGVYLCRCGANIGGVIDVSAVAEYVRSLDGVAIVRENGFMCSESGQELLVNDIKDHGLDRVVVAACSPHLHEETFRMAAVRAGLNPFLVVVCNVREQIAWIADSGQAASVRAQSQVAATVARVGYQREIVPERVPVNPATLVVGGGIAGIEAALRIASAGYGVYLVEQGPSLGGHMAQLDTTFPALECGACILTPRMSAVAHHPGITLLTMSEVEAVAGGIGNFTVRVRTNPRSVSPELCNGCGICEEKCPKRVVDTGHNAGLGNRKAIHFPFAQAVPFVPVLERSDCLYFSTGKCRLCEKFCPTGAIDLKEKEVFREIGVGQIIIATGYSLFNAARISQYGYGRFADVFSALEMERMLSSIGPTGGKVVRRDGITQPKRVAIIHCVGSRDRNYHEYCSKVCCMYSLKFARQIMEKTGAEVFNFYIDIRTPGKGCEEFYHQLQEKGGYFIRGRVAMVMEAAFTVTEEGHLIVQVEDTMIGRTRRIPVDMVILSPAMEPRGDAVQLATKFGLSCDVNGFLSEAHAKVSPVATMNPGVLIAGCCQGPKDIAETVAQAGAAAGQVLATIARGEVVIDPVRATIDADHCCGCRICNDLCPCQAITYDGERKISKIITLLCCGCGTCVAACPSGVIDMGQFTGDQVVAEIEGLLRTRSGDTTHGI